jgi:hypothetical protein
VSTWARPGCLEDLRARTALRRARSATSSTSSPFECDGCDGFFCAAHRVYWDHGCAKAADQGRAVVVCPDCGDAIERTVPGQGDRENLDVHARPREILCAQLRPAGRMLSHIKHVFLI